MRLRREVLGHLTHVLFDSLPIDNTWGPFVLAREETLPDLLGSSWALPASPWHTSLFHCQLKFYLFEWQAERGEREKWRET